LLNAAPLNVLATRITRLGPSEPTASSPLRVPLLIDGAQVLAHLDQGAGCSIISQAMANSMGLVLLPVSSGFIRGFSPAQGQIHRLGIRSEKY
jgi:hypothetical protein